MSSLESSTETWIPALPVPQIGAGSELRVEFALAPEAESMPGAPPFLSLGDSGRFARVLLARLADRNGRTLQPLACKLQRDVYRGVGGAVAGHHDNRSVAAMWDRERHNLDLLAGTAAPRALAATGTPGPLPPIAYDPERRQLFRVRAPGSLTELCVCEDDEVLRAAGLEPWSTSLQRYLWVPGAADTFYLWSRTEGAAAEGRPRGAVRTLLGTDLYVELARTWCALAADRRAALAAEWPDGAAALGALAEPEAARRFVPLCFYPAHALLLGLQDLHFDEYCDLAGGASLAQIEHAARRTGTPGRRVAFARLAPVLGGEQQWQAAPWQRGDQAERLADIGAERLRRLALEATFLKLQAFHQVCRATHAYHAATAQPHLGLSPDNVMLRCLGGAEAAAPARWRFTATIVDTGSSHRVALSGLRGKGALPELFRPSSNSARAFVSPLADLGRAMPELAVQVAARRREDGGLGVELHSAHERFENVEPDDLVRIVADGPLPGLSHAVLLGVITTVTDHGRNLTAIVPLDPDQGAELPRAQFPFAAMATCHRRLQTPCDLYSLGMLLSRAILCHDERDAFAVRELWDRVLDKFDLMVSPRPDPARIAVDTIVSLLSAEAAHFASTAVLYPKALRDRIDPPLPPALWRDLLLLVARLMTNLRGFSFASHHGDLGGGAPADLMTQVLRETEDLLGRLQAELDDSLRGAEVAAIAGDLMREVTSTLIARGGGGA